MHILTNIIEDSSELEVLNGLDLHVLEELGGGLLQLFHFLSFLNFNLNYQINIKENSLIVIVKDR